MSILDICKWYIESNWKVNTFVATLNARSNIHILNEKRAIQRLADIASEFNCMPISPDTEQDEDVNDNLLLRDTLYDSKDDSTTMIYFDIDNFYSFIDCDMNDDNVGKMLQLMYKYMGTNLEKKNRRQFY